MSRIIAFWAMFRCLGISFYLIWGLGKTLKLTHSRRAYQSQSPNPPCGLLLRAPLPKVSSIVSRILHKPKSQVLKFVVLAPLNPKPSGQALHPKPLRRLQDKPLQVELGILRHTRFEGCRVEVVIYDSCYTRLQGMAWSKLGCVTT